jgi:hypothetical protein
MGGHDLWQSAANPCALEPPFCVAGRALSSPPGPHPNGHSGACPPVFEACWSRGNSAAARLLLANRPTDVNGVGHRVGYRSPSPVQPGIPAPVRCPAHPGRGTHARRSRSRCCRRSRLSEEDCATTRDDLASPRPRCCFLEVPEPASILGQSPASKRRIVKQSGLRPAGDVVARALEIGPDSSPAERTIDITTVAGAAADRRREPLDPAGRAWTAQRPAFEWLG